MRGINRQCIMEVKHNLTDKEARDIIIKLCKVRAATDLQNIENAERNKNLKELKEQFGISIRQIERLTGINRGIVLRAYHVTNSVPLTPGMNYCTF